MKNQLALLHSSSYNALVSSYDLFFVSAFLFRGLALGGAGFVAQAAAVNVQPNMINL